MSILGTLRQNRAGEWKNLDEYLRELRHREAGALAALATALTAPPEEQKELVAHGEAGAILIEVACDLRVPKGARLAASRALLEAGIAAPFIGHLFIGAGDLVTDPRLGAMARKLVESGLPCALHLGGEPAQITLAAGAFARAAYAGASAVGAARIQELLEPAKKLHAGAIAALFALDAGELPEDHRDGWKRLLEQTCAAHRRAPAAARRVGLVPAWPPNLPEKFAPFIEEAERQNAAVESADAGANPAALKKARAAAQPMGKSREATTEKVPPPPAGKKLAPPIRRSPFKRAIGTVVEVPTTLPPKPMEAVAARGAPAVERPRVERTEEAPPSRGPLPIAPLLSRQTNELRFDARGRRIPRADRWRDDQFEWEMPVLPSSDLPPPGRARVAPGPFAARLRSILDDRPEAVDRLCAAAEARSAVRGEPELLRELGAELSRDEWRERVLPREQLQRLRSILRDHAHPPAWSVAAGRLLDFFVSSRA